MPGLHPASIFVKVLRKEISASDAELLLAGKDLPVRPRKGEKSPAERKFRTRPRPCRTGAQGVCLVHGQPIAECQQDSREGQER